MNTGGDGALSDRGMIILELSQSSIVKFICLSITDHSSDVLLKLRGADAVREGLDVYGVQLPRAYSHFCFSCCCRRQSNHSLQSDQL